MKITLMNTNNDTGLNVKYWCLFVGTFILQSSVFSHWFYSTVPNDKREEKKNSSDTYTLENTITST